MRISGGEIATDNTAHSEPIWSVVTDEAIGNLELDVELIDEIERMPDLVGEELVEEESSSDEDETFS